MQKKKTKWEAKDKIPENVGRQLAEYPNLIRQILYNRGITTANEANAFLRANTPEYDPFELKDIKTAVEMVFSAIEANKKIIVFGDYDVDGVTASVLLVQLLQRYKANVDVFIPNRFKQGYGLSSKALEEVLVEKPDLLITVDCGVRSVNEVTATKELGVKVIITDHHQPHDILPPADAIICPKQPGDDYPYKGLAGVGVAYKLAAAILTDHPLPNLNADEWIDMVAVGTIADLAPLDGENRTLVRRGLRRIRLGGNKGLLALCNVSGTDINKICAQDIGFRLGPRLNAAGRLGSAYLAFDLLMAQKTENAGELALQLDQKNRDRQQITREIEEKAAEMYDTEKNQRFLFFWSEDFHEGVVGLAASKLAEKFNLPAIVGVQKDGIIRASCRSIDVLKITSALDECEEFLIQHGGHDMAAGLSIDIKNTDAFMRAFDAVCIREYDKAVQTAIEEADANEKEKAGNEALLKRYYPELEVAFSDLEPKNLEYYEVLEPLGICNPFPLFISRNVTVKWAKRIGREKEHLRLGLSDGTMDFSAVAFNFGEFEDMLKEAETIDILFAYELNEYNGNKSLQLRLKDFHLPEGNIINQ